MFPLRLSENYKDNSYWQIDLLIDSDDFYEPSLSHNDQPISSPSHFLFIRRLVFILQAFKNKSSNRTLYSYCCRACMRIFANPTLLTDHQISCDAHSVQSGKIYRRRQCKNQLLHRPYTFISNTVMLKNGLRLNLTGRNSTFEKNKTSTGRIMVNSAISFVTKQTSIPG